MFDIPLPSFGDLYVEQATAPFFVFQVNRSGGFASSPQRFFAGFLCDFVDAGRILVLLFVHLVHVAGL